MKPIIVFFYIIIAAMLLAECTTLQPTQGASPTGTPAVVPSSTPLPTDVTTQTPLPTPTATQPLPQAIINVEQFLAKKLSIQVDKIKVVAFSAVEWPDGCMGVHIPGVMCAMIVTPGYKVLLQVGSKVYELHSNRTGQAVLLVTDPLHSETAPTIVWQSAGQACQQVMATVSKVIFGCYPATKTVAMRADRAADFLHFTQTFASFSANTPAGQLTFVGQGPAQADPDQHRSIAEWAHLVFLETQSGQSDASLGLSMDFHRHGGIAGFSDDINVYSAGYAMVSTDNGDPQAFTKVYLDAGQVKQLYHWLDTFQRIDYKQDSPANVADGMSIDLGLAGTGKQAAADKDIQDVLSFGSSLATR
jgi:hypothetical protein